MPTFTIEETHVTPDEGQGVTDFTFTYTYDGFAKNGKDIITFELVCSEGYTRTTTSDTPDSGNVSGEWEAQIPTGQGGDCKLTVSFGTETLATFEFTAA